MSIDWTELSKIAATVFLSTVSGLLVAIVAYKLGDRHRKKELDQIIEQNRIMAEELKLLQEEAEYQRRLRNSRRTDIG